MPNNQQRERIIDTQRQSGRIRHSWSGRTNQTRETIAGQFHLADEEADFLFLRLRFLLQAGQFGDAFTALACVVLDLQEGRSVFTGFNAVGQLPLGMSRLRQDDLNAMETCGVFTVGQLLQADDEELIQVENVTPVRMARIRRVVDSLVEDYRAWRRTLRKREVVA